MTTANVLTAFGGFLEIVGFGLVVARLSHLQRTELGVPRWFAGFVNRRIGLRYTTKPRVIKSISNLRWSDWSQSGSTPATTRRTPKTSAPIGERLEDLEREVDLLRESLVATENLATQRADEVASALELGLYRLESEVTDQRKSDLQASILWEGGGVVFFVTGVILTIIGNLA